ncbi:DNA circularization protein [Burkholderia pseudomallei]|uniref:DNA circularization protein n=1 Tax=Burkholderia pseudomallei TaxID=28450 RepID=UPI000977C98D|nr:DNA circularization N-terminal domain-containing protein [Burkholderia pseudomallei]OMQ57071.1 DNA circulation family protein [Burkholderia pseudomallei]OMQ65137.1 DNA circulation family protein [Burkholderia pseudomallei]OMQ72868.1 DNA circulation family protein [Burkholderia pseudomallei]CAJ2713930.1 DNA circulation family protein [Burkholderia pseudomallei]CAJ4671927.1 DNA circulation family protein [Burkholderia pseudomallei]
MSFLANVGNAVGAIGGVAQAASDIASLFANGSDYWRRMRTASYNGVPFAVLSESGTFGRRSVVHEYPNKETMPWIEDLGLQTNVFRIYGFLVENSLVYGGGSVIDQRQRLVNVIQGGKIGNTKAPGLGSLVHPTWGTIKANCIEVEFGTSWDRGRVVEVRFVFVRGGDRLYPQAKKPTSSAVLAAVNGLYTPTFLGCIKALASAVVSGAQMVQAAVSTVVGWYQTVTTLIRDVKRFWNSISTLAGNFGRFFGGGNSGFAGTNGTVSSAATTAPSLLSADTANRAAVTAAGSALTAATANIKSDPTTFCNAAKGVVTALAASAASPADAIRLLTSLLAFSPTPVVGSSQSAIRQNVVQGACADMFRRVVIAQIATSSTQYQPTSADDASAMRDSITALIDNEITTAANQGADDIYTALRVLRQAVVADLDQRGSGLASIATFNFNATLPALTLANRIYRDSTRSDELVTQANPIHPAFVSTTFRALSS